MNNSLQDIYEINHGSEIVGKLGGSSGDYSNLKKVKIIFEKGTGNIITAYPF